MSPKTSNFSEFEHTLMKRLLNEAKRFEGLTHPNPMVAAAVYKDEQLISIGVHEKKGGPHAEVFALRKAGDAAKGACLMVTLEPCTHQGATGPCAEAIVESGISDVVYAIRDEFSSVKGKPAQAILEAAGISVRIGLLEKEAYQLNEAYFYCHKHKRPFVILKAAMSLDGCIAMSSGESKYLSCKASLKRVHDIRSQVTAILIGRETLIQDDAQCTVRHVPLKDGQAQPACMVLGRSDHVPQSLRVFQTSARHIYVTSKQNTAPISGFDDTWSVLNDSDQIDWPSLFKACVDNHYYSLLIEGGAGLYSSALSAGIVNKAYFFITPKLMGYNQGLGLCALPKMQSLNDMLRCEFSAVEKSGDDLLISAAFPDILAEK